MGIRSIRRNCRLLPEQIPPLVVPKIVVFVGLFAVLLPAASLDRVGAEFVRPVEELRLGVAVICHLRR